MTDTEATKPKKAKSPEKELQGRAERLVSRTLPKLEGDGTAEELKARWTANKAKYNTDAKRIVKALAKGGMTFGFDETQTGKSKRADKQAAAEAEGTAAE